VPAAAYVAGPAVPAVRNGVPGGRAAVSAGTPAFEDAEWSRHRLCCGSTAGKPRPPDISPEARSPC
jgi:hypothetical protein